MEIKPSISLSVKCSLKQCQSEAKTRKRRELKNQHAPKPHSARTKVAHKSRRAQPAGQLSKLTASPGDTLVAIRTSLKYSSAFTPRRKAHAESFLRRRLPRNNDGRDSLAFERLTQFPDSPEVTLTNLESMRALVYLPPVSNVYLFLRQGCLERTRGGFP